MTLLTKEMTLPNGIAFSPDEKTLYVAKSDPTAAIWMAFPVKERRHARPGARCSSTPPPGSSRMKGLPDGMKVDTRGNLFATGPGGVLVFTPDGKHLGTFATGEATANCAGARTAPPSTSPRICTWCGSSSARGGIERDGRRSLRRDATTEGRVRLRRTMRVSVPDAFGV